MDGTTRVAHLPKEKEMGVFSRFLDIVNANINALLDKAEDPEKMLKLMMQEMEDTLIELKSSCAAKMASKAKTERKYRETENAMQRWQSRAELAIAKDREDLAREALLEKKRAREELDLLAVELETAESQIRTSKDEISQIEDKLLSVKQKYKIMVERAKQAMEERVAQETLKRAAENATYERFASMEEKIDRMHAENSLNKGFSDTLDDRFKDLEQMDDIDAEIAELLKRAGK
jgi:phage shock protein A